MLSEATVRVLKASLRTQTMSAPRLHEYLQSFLVDFLSEWQLKEIWAKDVLKKKEHGDLLFR